MPCSPSTRLAVAAVCACLVSGAGSAVLASNWPQWRGPLLNGTSTDSGVPTTWTQTSNVAWKVKLPSWSGSTPIVWDTHVFLNVADGDALSLWAIDRNKGTVLWQRPLGGGNRKERKQNMSSPSPVTDGQRVWVMTGTGRLAAFDFAGRQLWSRDLPKDFGPFGLQWGYGSSPLLHEGSLYVQVLHGMYTDDPSYVVKIDGITGKTLWRVERPNTAFRESPDAYTTPVIMRTNDRTELIVTGADVITGHDTATGRELWRAKGLNPSNNGSYRIVASPVPVQDLVIAPTRERPMLAVRIGGQGDVTATRRVWASDEGPDVPTPVTDGTYLYVVRDNGVVWCLDVRTGAKVYGPQRLRSGTYSASPVLVDGKLYVTNEDGLTTVLKAGSQFAVLAENALDDYVLSSPAVSDGQLFLRTAEHLWAIGQRRAR